MSVDRGKVRLRTPQREEHIWRDYKPVNLYNRGVEAFFKENASFVEWVNAQPLANQVICLRDENVPQLLKHRSPYLNGQFSRWVLQRCDALGQDFEQVPKQLFLL